MSESLCVYTAITGPILDTLFPISAPADILGRPVEFVCFTDRLSTGSRGWQIYPLQHQCDTPRLTARWHKIMSHVLFPKAQYTLWHDGSHHLSVSPWEIVDEYLSKGERLATFRHPKRDCVYTEARICVKLGKDSRPTLNRQIERYRRLGLPEHFGLYETGCVIRHHCERVKQLNALWLEEVMSGSSRDQISLPYALWALHFQGVAILPGSGSANPFFFFNPHRSPREFGPRTLPLLQPTEH
jgi:hypothetical protein